MTPVAVKLRFTLILRLDVANMKRNTQTSNFQRFITSHITITLRNNTFILSRAD